MSLAFGGIPNIVIIGLPLYIWAIVGTIILSAIIFVIMRFTIWESLSPLHGVIHGKQNGTNCSLVIDKFGTADIISETESKAIWSVEDPKSFEYDGPRQAIKEIPETFGDYLMRKLLHRNRTIQYVEIAEKRELPRTANGIISGVRMDIVADLDRWTVPNSRQHNIIAEACSKWNELNPSDPVLTFDKFQYYVGLGRINPPEGIQFDFLTPWNEIDAVFPEQMVDGMWNGRVREVKDDLIGADKREATRLGIYVLGACMLIAIIIMVIRLVTHYV